MKRPHISKALALTALLLGLATGAARAQTEPAPILSPTRTYFAPAQPLTLRIASPQPLELVLIDFAGGNTIARSPTINPTPSGVEVDARSYFPAPMSSAGTFLLAAVPAGKNADPRTEFVGTPLVVSVRADGRRSAPPGPMVFRIEPLRYAVFSTTAGDLRVCFYYEVAPNTVNTIQRLITEGFYDGLPFFRVEPGFVAQTGDPRADGTGGPGFMIDAEFSDRQHLEGVLSIARATDPNEAPGLLPRSEFANSGGSQFFICLNYFTARQLDRRYSAFARIVDGLDVLRTIGSKPVDPKAGPSAVQSAPKIVRAKLVNVTASDNPYSRLKVVEPATTQPVR